MSDQFLCPEKPKMTKKLIYAMYVQRSIFLFSEI